MIGTIRPATVPVDGWLANRVALLLCTGPSWVRRTLDAAGTAPATVALSPAATGTRAPPALTRRRLTVLHRVLGGADHHDRAGRAAQARPDGRAGRAGARPARRLTSRGPACPRPRSGPGGPGPRGRPPPRRAPARRCVVGLDRAHEVVDVDGDVIHGLPGHSVAGEAVALLLPHVHRVHFSAAEGCLSAGPAQRRDGFDGAIHSNDDPPHSRNRHDGTPSVP